MRVRALAATVGLAALLAAAPEALGSVRPAALQLGAAAAVLADVRTGRILYDRDMHRPLPPASTTKILTATLVLERLPLDRALTVGGIPAGMRTGTTVGLRAGERWTVRELLVAMLVGSANDAALALAEGVSGSVEAFVALMNARARQLGARRSHFVNPHGLHDPAHVGTAYDLMVITRHALHHPALAATVRMPAFILQRADRPPQVLANTNRLLARYPGADGVKTGWTAAAGQTLVASATREGWQLLAVVLRSGDMYRDAAHLLDYGFATFAPVRVAGRGQALATIIVGPRREPLPAVVPAEVVAVVRRGAAVSPRVTLRGDLRPPIAAGAPVGEVRFLEGRDVVAHSVLVAARSVHR
ncbi:MAG: D-alanyl-D-alanine carboxypeptidase family protein [Armatimonadota bacterium]|nr:D-alanyl-D-alanine carboxypeptidase family protein [Armatimonadota bacterium]